MCILVSKLCYIYIRTFLTLNLTIRYVDDVLSFNNPIIWSMIMLTLYILRNVRLDTTDAPKWDNYLDFCLGFDEDGRFYTRLYDFGSPLVNFPYLNQIFQNPLHMVFLFHS